MESKNGPPSVVSVVKIWDRTEHNALTDLIRFKDTWYCAFRESDKHVYGQNGIIRIIKSSDALNWVSAALIKEEGVDLRDPKLSITPAGQLMLLIGGTEYTASQRYVTRQPRVSFSKDGEEWGPLQLILEPQEWLWRVTWHNGKAYGASYRFSNPSQIYEEWNISLFSSENGIDFQQITQWDIPGQPNETTIGFMPDDKMVALVRREKIFNNNAWIGTSVPPYTDWQWTQTHLHLGGPNFISLPNLKQWAGGRILYVNPYGIFEKSVLALMTEDDLYPVLTLPSGGDCSYPGMVYFEDYLWMSYYSSHEGSTAIYLAKIQLN